MIAAMKLTDPQPTGMHDRLPKYLTLWSWAWSLKITPPLTCQLAEDRHRNALACIALIVEGHLLNHLLSVTTHSPNVQKTSAHFKECNRPVTIV
jgi:hypothetical protein